MKRTLLAAHHLKSPHFYVLIYESFFYKKWDKLFKIFIKA